MGVLYDPAAAPDDDSYQPADLGQRLQRSDLGQLPKVQELIKGVVSTPATTVLVGAYGTGKTVLVHGFACCVATGQPWLGQAVTQRRVLVVVGEGAYGLETRLAGWELRWNRGSPVPDDAITFLFKPDTLSRKNTWQTLTDFAVTGDYGLVILDTFSSLAYDADETKDAASVMRWLSDLSAATNGTALLVHHPGWADNSRARGGSQLESNADEVLVLTGFAQGSGLVSLVRKKVKDGPSGDTLWLNRRETGSTLTHAGTVIMERADAADLDVPLRDRLLVVLDACGAVGATGPQLVAELEVEPKNRSGLYKAVNRLVTEEVVTAVGPRGRSTYYLTHAAPREAE
jgi:hypothetical protein